MSRRLILIPKGVGIGQRYKSRGENIYLKYFKASKCSSFPSGKKTVCFLHLMNVGHIACCTAEATRTPQLAEK